LTRSDHLRPLEQIRARDAARFTQAHAGGRQTFDPKRGFARSKRLAMICDPGTGVSTTPRRCGRLATQITTARIQPRRSPPAHHARQSVGVVEGWTAQAAAPLPAGAHPKLTALPASGSDGPAMISCRRHHRPRAINQGLPQRTLKILEMARAPSTNRTKAHRRPAIARCRGHANSAP